MFRKLFFPESIKEYRLDITVQNDDEGLSILNCNILKDKELIDTIQVGTLSELQDIIAVKYN